MALAVRAPRQILSPHGTTVVPNEWGAAFTNAQMPPVSELDGPALFWVAKEAPQEQTSLVIDYCVAHASASPHMPALLTLRAHISTDSFKTVSPYSSSSHHSLAP